MQLPGQEVYKWLAVPWVTARQEQLLVERVPEGFFPGSNPCGGCKNIRFSLACIPMALLKPYEVFLVFLGPCWPLGLSLAFPPSEPIACLLEHPERASREVIFACRS